MKKVPNMYKVILLVIFVIANFGCSSLKKQTIDGSTAMSLKSQTITYTVREKPDFLALTPGAAGFGLFGGGITSSEGNFIVDNYQVSDPAETIAIGLAKSLETNFGSQLIIPPIPVDSEDPIQITSSSTNTAKYIIDTQTVNWGIGYFPTDWFHYRINYTAKARLIQVATKTVIAEAFCKHMPDDSASAPLYNEMLANNAMLLKKLLASATEECLKTIKFDMLSL